MQRHHDTFEDRSPESYEPSLGPLRPVVSEVFGKFLQCGVLKRGFARVRCNHCTHAYLVAFSRVGVVVSTTPSSSAARVEWL